MIATIDWAVAAPAGSVAVTLLLGLLTLFRGAKANEALTASQNVQTTFTATKDLIDQLQEEVIAGRQQMKDCEDRCKACNERIRDAEARAVESDVAFRVSLTKITHLERRVLVLVEQVRALRGEPT